MHLKISSVKWQPFCPGGDELIREMHWCIPLIQDLWPLIYIFVYWYICYSHWIDEHADVWSMVVIHKSADHHCQNHCHNHQKRCHFHHDIAVIDFIDSLVPDFVKNFVKNGILNSYLMDIMVKYYWCWSWILELKMPTLKIWMEKKVNIMFKLCFEMLPVYLDISVWALAPQWYHVRQWTFIIDAECI